MAKGNIYNEIDQLLSSIIKKTEKLKRDNAADSQIEVDIIKTDIRTLYQLYDKIKFEEEQVIIKIEEAEKPAKKEGKEKTIIAEKIKEEKTPTIEPVQEKNVIEKVVVAEEKIIVEEQISLKQTVKSDLFSASENTTIADKFKDEKKSINDKIGLNKHDQSLAEKLNTNHVEDIKSLIGINEKFLFINELFEGNMSEYNQFITQLNTCKSFVDANSFIAEQKSKRQWKESLNALSTLNQLVSHKYK